MREIKFRAWNKHNKHFERMDDSWTFINGVITHKFWNNSSLEKHYDIQQYTGLKDKNGVEIYEGDIIKYDFNELHYRIEFVNAEFIARRFYENIENLYPTEFDYGKECEVVGNIYENPELLE